MRTWSQSFLTSLVALAAVQVMDTDQPLKRQRVSPKQHGYSRAQADFWLDESTLRSRLDLMRATYRPGVVGGPKQPPLVLDQIRELVPILPDAALAGEIRDRGINFQMSEEIINGLKRTGAGSQTVRVLSSFISNRPPSVMLTIDQPDIQQGETLTVFADAKDPDGDELQYYWASSAGTITSDGAIGKLDTRGIVMSSNSIQAIVSLTVSDRKGGTDSYTRSITVRRRVARTAPGEGSSETTNIQSKPTTIQEASTEGKYTLVRLEGQPSDIAGAWGFIEVVFSTVGVVPTIRSVTGILPAVPCRVDIVARENVAEYSFKEPPGTFNQWRRVLVRVRPKDPKRVIRFAIYWQVLEKPSVR